MRKRQTETAKIEDVPKMGFLRAKELSVMEIGEYVFCDEPQPREVSVRKPKSKAWDMQASSSFSMRMNGGGYKI